MNIALSRDGADTRYRAIGLIVACCVLWSTAGLLIKWVSWNPIAIAGGRSAIAAVVIWAYLRRPHITWSKVQIAGALAYAGTVILFVTANKLTTAANAILLQYTAPIYTALLGAWFLGERPSWLDWASIVAVVGGVALFFLDELSPGGLLGNVLALAAGLSFACLVLLMRKQKNGSPLESVLLGNLLAALISVPFMIGPPPSLQSIAALLVLGVAQLGLSYILYAEAIKHVRALESVLIQGIEPILNPLWVFLFLGETPGRWALAGGAVVLIAVTVRSALMALPKRD